MRHIDREATVTELSAGKRVLHLGCVGYHWNRNQAVSTRYDESLHARIQRVAGEVVGVDTNTEIIDDYARAGIDHGMVVGDVEDLGALDLGEPFDLIVSGNVIEHLSNPGRMLDGMRELSHAGTVILVTTPHGLSLRKYVSHVRGRLREGDDHVMTFNGPALANFISRHGFRVLSVDTGHGGVENIKLRGRLAHAVVNRFPQFGRTLVAQAELP